MAAHQTNRNRRLDGSNLPSSIEALESRRLLSADLVGSFAGAVPAALSPGGVNHVTLRVTNPPGQNTTGPVTVSLYLSQTMSLGNDAILLGTATRQVHLRGGQSAPFPFRFPSPSAVTSGEDYLLAQIDGPSRSDGAASETFVVSPRAVAVFQPVVDLSGQIAALPMTLFVNSSYPTYAQARIQVFNTGNVPARGPLQITMYASTDGAIDSTATVLGVTTFPAVNIRAGGSHMFAVPLTVPAGMPVGSYTALASINSSNTIVESNTANDIAVGQHPLTLANAPVLIDLRHHHHFDNGGGNVDYSQVDVVIDTGDGYSDSGTDISTTDSAPPPDTGNSDATTQPATGNDGSGGSDSGGSDFGGDTSGGNSPGGDSGGSSSGDSSGGGSDFGNSSPVDPNAGSDFAMVTARRPATHTTGPVFRA